MASGRVARQERWAFTSIENEICIRGLAPSVASGLRRAPVPRLRRGTATGQKGGSPLRRAPVPCVERYRLVPDPLPESVGLVGSWDYVASLFIIGDAVAADVWKSLEAAIAVILDERPGLVLGAVSTPAAPGLVVKLVARSAPDLTETLESLWAAVRKELWDLPTPNLRRY
jgi:urease accessory protein